MFVLDVYSISRNFPNHEIYDLTKQLKSAAKSIAANIAEGSGKRTQKEFARFLQISLGSASECEYFILLCRDLSYISEEEFVILDKQIAEIKKMLYVLLRKVRATIH